MGGAGRQKRATSRRFCARPGSGRGRGAAPGLERSTAAARSVRGRSECATRLSRLGRSASIRTIEFRPMPRSASAPAHSPFYGASVASIGLERRTRSATSLRHPVLLETEWCPWRALGRSWSSPAPGSRRSPASTPSATKKAGGCGSASAPRSSRRPRRLRRIRRSSGAGTAGVSRRSAPPPRMPGISRSRVGRVVSRLYSS